MQSAVFAAVRSFVLASASPRRRELLASLGIAFEVVPGGEAEPAPEAGEDPQAYAQRAARAKAWEVAPQVAGRVVLAADTIVVIDGQILGKPAHAAEALAMLGRLAGRDHEVITGVCLLDHGHEQLFATRTLVRMVAARPEVLAAYVATGEPMDKAGAYAIQGLGSCLVRAIEGSYTNVVGLPLAEVVDVLMAWGILAPTQGLS